MSWNPAKGSLSSRGLLDRVVSNSQTETLTQNQSAVDQLVGSALETAADEKMMASFFAAGAAGKFIRLGTLVNSASTLEGLSLRALSHVTALAGESAVFAGMERNLADHAPTHSFQKDWARAFINLGSLKLLGGAGASQNLVLQHLLADAGMVSGQEIQYIIGLTEAPQGSLAQRMIQAEGMNLGMKGSLALLHGFAPGLSAMERSVDLALMGRATNPFSKNLSLSFFPELALAAEGPKGIPDPTPKGPEDLALVFSKGDSKGVSGKVDLGSGKFERMRGPDEDAKDSAAIALVQTGLKDIKLSQTLHQSALEYVAEAEAVKKGSLEARNLYKRAMELEWGAAAALKVGDEPARATLYRDAVLCAVKALSFAAAKEIIQEGLRGDETGLFEQGLRKSAGELGYLSRDKKFILDTLALANEYQKVPRDLTSEPNEAPVMVGLSRGPETPVSSYTAGDLTPLEFSEELHGKALRAAKEARALDRRDPLKQELYARAMELEWRAAAELPPRNEKRRATLYRRAMEWALKAGRSDDAKKIIFNAVLNDFGALAEDAIRQSAEELWWWDGNRRFILTTLEEGKASRKLMEALQPALAGGQALAPRSLPPIFMMSGTSTKNGDSPQEVEIRASANLQAESVMDASTLKARELLKVGEGAVASSVALETKAVCINVGRYYFAEKVRPDTTIKNADLYIEHQGIGRGYLFITNKSGKDLFLLDAEGEPRKVIKDIAYPLLPGEKFVFNGKLYTWGKPKESPRPSQGQPHPALETVKALNARILGDEESAAVLQAGVYYGLKRDQLRSGAEDRTVRIPIFLDISSGLIAAVGEAPEELRSKTVPVELIVLVPKSDRTKKDQAPTIVGLTLSGSGTWPGLAEAVENLNGKTFLYPHFGMPSMEHGNVILDARRSRTFQR